MAKISEEVSSDAGTWLTIEEWDGARLHALVHRSENEPEAGVTIFWPARRAPEAFTGFFEEALPRVSEFRRGESRLDRVVYVRETGEATGFKSGDERHFGDFDFLRFASHRLGADRAEHPVLVVWTNLDAGVEKVVPADAAGVLLQPRHLEGLERPLAALIAETSAEEPSLGSIASMLVELAQYLRPHAEPIAAMA
jgi:hypothetical protein